VELSQQAVFLAPSVKGGVVDDDGKSPDREREPAPEPVCRSVVVISECRCDAVKRDDIILGLPQVVEVVAVPSRQK
jgi:hypothetical protein